jgi:hypothetical protein
MLVLKKAATPEQLLGQKAATPEQLSGLSAGKYDAPWASTLDLESAMLDVVENLTGCRHTHET